MSILLQHPSSPVKFMPMPDPREQRVLPALADTPEAQAQRMQAIETLGGLVNRYGLAIVARWVNERDAAVLSMVEDFGEERVGKWLRYFAYEQGQRERSK